MNVWFTSDEHYDHANIIKYCNRPYVGVDEMREDMIARHNSVVQDDDVVWHLGDFSMSEKTVPLVLPRLKGKHCLIVGNHDACHPARAKSVTKTTNAYSRYVRYGFRAVLDVWHFKSIPAVANHFPYANTEASSSDVENYVERYPEYRLKKPVHDIDWLLHGHIHNMWKVKDRMINVGVDVWDFYPVNMDVIKDIIDGKVGV